MAEALSRMQDEKGRNPRQMYPRWNYGLIAASIAISLLGAFTATQLMCQARDSHRFSTTLIWTMLGSLAFGFCSIWSLHEVAMLACELDLPIGIDVPLTILSSVLAVVFTFAALASDMLLDRYNRVRQKRRPRWKKERSRRASSNRPNSSTRDRELSEPLLSPIGEDEENQGRIEDLELAQPSHPSFDYRSSLDMDDNTVFDTDSQAESPSPAQPALEVDPAQPYLAVPPPNGKPSPGSPRNHSSPGPRPPTPPRPQCGSGSEASFSHMLRRTSSLRSASTQSFSFLENSSSSTLRPENLVGLHGVHRNGLSSTKNAVCVMGNTLYTGCTRKNIIKGFLWSLAITSMHFVGLLALSIPEGYFALNPLLVFLAATISWAVCLVGCILMAQMETHLAQQFLFSVVATTGVAAMHFTGMQAATFWSYAPASEKRGYPPGLAIAIGSIAITTCIAANALLAHSAIDARNKLLEIVWTRRKLWMAIAQKENAESAAAARSEFIASASHEIRTPLHHLQGYSDLLSRTELTEEGRLLLYAIQHATKTLSLITNNVLDWSRLESDGEMTCKPVALDMRTVCESIVTLLPNKDDDADVEMMLVVAPDVPPSLLIDETYINRILMNLLSNALKFTSSGYILLLIEMENDRLVATVKDTGIGVPPSFLPRLFEPFTQAQTRGSQRGTGLGLSIIKQLLQKMGGTIEVDSRHQETEGVEPGQTGSTFTITLPVQPLSSPQNGQQSNQTLRKVAIFHGGDERSLEGLCTAWGKFKFEVLIAKHFSDLAGLDLQYIWADLASLTQSPALFDQLLAQDRWLVLVPCDSHVSLQDVPGFLPTSRLVPIQKPLIWHAIESSIALASQPSSKTALGRSVRFAPKVDVVKASENEKEKPQEDTKSDKGSVILLVEDNQINRKLGIKMLTSLGYQVLTADDGVEAIEQVLAHDATIDAILMDQSMPRKDGLTATREIRELEANGTLSRRRPIIAVTAVVSSQAQTLCRLAGTDDFLAKPLSLGRLESCLREQLGGG